MKAAPIPLPLKGEIHSASSFLLWWNSSKHTLCSYFLLRNPPALWNRLLAGCLEFELGKLWAAAELEKGLEATLSGRAGTETMQALRAQLGPGHAHHAKEAEGETWLRFIGWVMEGWANYNKGGINGWEPPMKVPWPALPRRETSLFPRVSGISGLSPPCGRRADTICFGSGGCG